MGFRGVRVGGVSVLIDVDDALAERVHRRLPWRRRARPVTAAPAAVSTVATAREPRPKEAGLRRRVAEVEWYHTIDLGNGVVTPGSFDHRPYLQRFGVPDRLDGKRVLDVATFDGFWAFEFERRGAADVVAIDLDEFRQVDLAPRVRAKLSAEQLHRPLGTGFAIAHETLGSQVRREPLNVYDLSPARLGTFDFVFCSDLLLHLTNPIKALENIRSVVSGRAVIVDTFHPSLPQQTVKYHGGADTCVWWFFSLGALEQMIRDAGFEDVQLLGKFQMRLSNGTSLWQAVFGGTA